MRKFTQIQLLFILLLFLVSCQGQRTNEDSKYKDKVKSNLETAPNISKKKVEFNGQPPNTITRTIIQDKSGNIWFATFEGVIKYDGTTFTNMTAEVSKSRFFSAMEDRQGNLWFGTIGSGVFRYDGKQFQNITTEDGLVNNEITCIYEDDVGEIWFGANGGISRYNGETFRNYIISGGAMHEDTTGKIIPNLQRPSNEVNSIIKDRSGSYWFGTRGDLFIYNRGSFMTLHQNNQSFTNMRSMIEDKKGRIWLGGNNGLWQYDGKAFTNITKNFVGYIYEDRKGNIWTSSDSGGGWSLSRYEVASLDKENKTVQEVKTGEGMFFGILEDVDGGIWSGTLNGVYRYDDGDFEDFKR